MEQIPLIQTILGKLCDLPVRAILLIIEAAAIELGQRNDEAYRKNLLSENPKAERQVAEQEDNNSPPGHASSDDGSDVDGEATPLYRTVLIPSTPMKRKRI